METKSLKATCDSIMENVWGGW